MKRIFAWIIMSLMSITAVMPSFIPFANQNETPSVVQVEKEDKENVTPTVVPDEPTPTPDTPTPEPTPEVDVPSVEEETEELGEVIPYANAISSTTVFNNFVAQKTAELNADIYETLKVPTTSEDYRGNELPSGYTQIEYLESTGTQWIDTGYANSNGYYSETKFMFNSFSNYSAVGGAENSTAGTSRNNICLSANGLIYGGAGVEMPTDISIATSTIYEVYTKTVADGDSWIYVDNVLKKSITNTGARSSFNIYLFTINKGGSAGTNYMFRGRIYYCKMYDETQTLVRDFVPCYNSNYTFGLYDVVGNQFYTNQGSGVFNALQTYIHSLQGSGTESDPYQIGDFYDFIYAFNKMGLPSNKYYVLTDDIIFNDGKFVENEETGIPEYHAGQNGELREFEYITTLRTGINFDGQGHSIKGLYVKNGLFYIYWYNSLTNSTFKNLHFVNSYNYSGNVHGILSNQVENCTFENCSTDGWVNGTFGSDTFIHKATNSKFLNCKNYAHNISATWQYPAGGIVGEAANCVIRNCDNFGNICEKTSDWCGGVVGRALSGTTVENCINKGAIAFGGICYSVDRTSKIVNCQNYGKANTGICYYGSGGLIDSCKNYGRCTDGVAFREGSGGRIVNSENHGECTCGFTYRGYNYPSFPASRVEILNSRNYGKCSYGFGCVEGGHDNYITITNCQNYGVCTTAGLVGGLRKDCKIINCVNYGTIKGSAGICNNAYDNALIQNCYNEGEIYGSSGAGICKSAASTVTIKNCINVGELMNGGNGIHTGSNTPIIQNCISNCKINDVVNKQYYGSDFSAFFLTWKDARIGLISLESTGLYRGQLTERYLYRNNFTPMDHMYEPSDEDREYMERKKQKEFNENYTQLEYLESTGTQWIDTGVLCKASGTLEYETELQYTRTSGRQIMGYDWPGGFEVDSSGKWKTFNQAYSIDKYDYYTMYLNFDTNVTKHTLNTTYEVNGTISSINGTRGNIKLFALGPYNSYFCYCKMKSFKIKVDETLIRDFVPVMRKSDQVLGLYDKVEGKFYTNQGTGTFMYN